MPCIRCYGIIVKKKKKALEYRIVRKEGNFWPDNQEIAFPGFACWSNGNVSRNVRLIKNSFFMVHKRSLL